MAADEYYDCCDISPLAGPLPIEEENAFIWW